MQHSPIDPLYPFYICSLDPNLRIILTHARRELAGYRGLVCHIWTLLPRLQVGRYLCQENQKTKKGSGKK